MSKKNVKIKYMSLSDIDDICEVEAEAYGEHHWSRNSFESEIRNRVAQYYVLRDEKDKLMGYLGSWIIVDEAHITTLAVSKEFRRCKTAQVLLIEFVKECYAAGVKYITLEVRVSNEPAINLYKKFGFKSLGERCDYYQDNFENALIMWTENIWYENFKGILKKLKEEVKDIEIKYEW